MAASDRLTRLRETLRRRALGAFVIPTADAHQSEYVSARDKRRAYLSGFSGSAGTAVVTLKDARLWTDGRYFAQAEKELDAAAGWKLMRDRLPETPTIEAWLAEAVPAEAASEGGAGSTPRVGLDPLLHTVAGVRRLEAALRAANVDLSCPLGLPNPVDEVWDADASVPRPAAPAAPLRVHELRFAGKSHDAKLALVRAKMAEAGAGALVVSALDEVAWLLNVRGGDVECNPVAIAYALVTAEEALLAVDEAKLTPEVRAHLGAGVRIVPYESILAEVEAAAAAGRKVWLDPSTCNLAVYQAAAGIKPSAEAAAGGAGGAAGGAGALPTSPAASAPSRVLERTSPIPLLKALKNDAELEGMRAAHVRDGVALVTFLAWLEAAVARGVDMRRGGAPLDFPLTEASIAAVLDGMRAEQDGFVSLSFDSIVGYKANGAIIHYRPEEGRCAAIDAGVGGGAGAMLLIDSGGQYVDGTTDVTRTVHLGEPSAAEREAYTAVLQGHIAMSAARFPPGTSGIAIDALARAPLWARGLDYRHGTGHGVGAFLNVHEGPQFVASAARSSYEGGLVPRMTITDEPGCYIDGAFGIRIENVLVVQEVETPHTFGGKPYCGFEPLTLAPISTKLIDPTMMSVAEKEWLNAYHAHVRTALAPLLSGFALEYLLRETMPI